MENEKPTLEGKSIIFKTLALSKAVFQASMTDVPTHFIFELEKIQKSFLWNNSTTKIKHETLRNDYKVGGIKNFDIQMKIISLQYSWVMRLYDDSFHEWKLMPLHFIKKSFGDSFNFHSNLLFNRIKISLFPKFYKEIFLNWKKFYNPSEVPSSIFSPLV